MARRKAGNSLTTISISWNDKEVFRKYAKLVKKTRNGEMYESDSVVFNTILNYYIDNVEPSSKSAKSTYPSKA